MARTIRSVRLAIRLAGLLVVAALLGCGGPVGVVHGNVTIDGVPATDGSVNFEPVDGQGPSTGAKITDGRYEAHVRPGKKRVTVRASVKTGKQVPAGRPAPEGTMIDELKFYPPPRVKPDVREVEVNAGENDIPFDLTTRPGGKKK
jgi:hypothetical protein